MLPERIDAAAVRYRGKVWWLVRPCRHCHVLHMIRQSMPASWQGPDLPDAETLEQGFVTTAGRFVGRIEAADVALRAGQTSALRWPPSLYSEDLW